MIEFEPRVTKRHGIIGATIICIKKFQLNFYQK